MSNVTFPLPLSSSPCPFSAPHGDKRNTIHVGNHEPLDLHMPQAQHWAVAYAGRWPMQGSQCVVRFQSNWGWYVLLLGFDSVHDSVHVVAVYMFWMCLKTNVSQKTTIIHHSPLFSTCFFQGGVGCLVCISLLSCTTTTSTTSTTSTIHAPFTYPAPCCPTPPALTPSFTGTWENIDRSTGLARSTAHTGCHWCVHVFGDMGIYGVGACGW